MVQFECAEESTHLFHCQAGPFSDDVCFHFFVSLCHQPGPDLPESKTDDDEEDNDKDDDVDI